MVFYVRFLKAPRLQKQKGGAVSVVALVSVTTDLGDAFLAQDADLLATLQSEDSQEPLYQEAVKWTAGKRELSITLGPFPEQLSRQAIVLGLNATDPRRPKPRSQDPLIETDVVPLVISGWSTPFGGPQYLAAEKLVERRFGGETDLRIWEETGNSIARHIWDAALASVIFLERAVKISPGVIPALSSLLQTPRNVPLHVLELGSGCGIVGIALAEMLPQCLAVLTDLPEVEDIITRNISAARPASSSSIEFQTLDWDEPDLDSESSGSLDLILISDCTYNADSLPALVSVLGQLTQRSPQALVLVALKRRHESEAVFFDLMRSVGLFSQASTSLSLPSQHGESDRVELYCYGTKNLG